MCENLSENEARLLILEQTQFLRVLIRKLGFLVNMPFQKSHKYWMQLPTTMKFCENLPHMYILKGNKFQVWKNMSKSRLENCWPKIGESGGNLMFFFVGGSNLKICENQLFKHIFTVKMDIVSKFESKRSKSVDFTANSVFGILTRRISFFVQPSIPKWP